MQDHELIILCESIVLMKIFLYPVFNSDCFNWEPVYQVLFY